MTIDFNYHTHTKRCNHAEENFEDEDYIKEAIQAGIKHLAFTDHMPFPVGIEHRTRQRMDYSLKEDYLSSIRSLAKKYEEQIDIKVGFEFEYLPSMKNHILELKRDSDIMIVGQHEIEKDGKFLDLYERYYNRIPMTDEELDIYVGEITESIQLGITDIIAHPDVFMRFRKEFNEKDREASHKICKIAQQYDIPVEINLCKIFSLYNTLNGYRELYDEQKEEIVQKYVKYPCREFWEIAGEYNLKTIYSSDTHFRGQILKMDKCIELSNKMIGQEHIDKLNLVDYKLK